MKKYKQRVPLIKFNKVTITAFRLVIVIALILVLVFIGIENIWFYSIVLIGIVDLFFYILNLIVFLGKYRYEETHIDLLYGPICYRKHNYSEYRIIVISNASYYHISVPMPIQYKSCAKNKTLKTTYPFITLHEEGYPIDKIKSGMYSFHLTAINNYKTFSLGICWFDSLNELLNYTDMPVYILEDVYLRFKIKFDEIILNYSDVKNRFYIIANDIVIYKEYI